MVAREGFVYEQKPLSITQNVVVGEGGRSSGVLLYRHLVIVTALRKLRHLVITYTLKEQKSVALEL